MAEKKKAGRKPESRQSPAGKSICIVCREEKRGRAVKDDVVIRAIRKIKQAFRVAANNRLVVCDGCLEKHKARRGGFERKLALYGGGGLLIVIVFTLISRTIGGFALSLLLGLFVAALALFSYHPASEGK